jgi:hypothetical protein
MDSTLERLKALNSKLDRKLKEKGAGSGEKEAGTLPETAKEVKKEYKVSVSRKSQKKDVVSQEENTEDLAVSLINVLGFCPETEPVRANNIYRLAKLYKNLEIFKKAPDFDNILIYKAMNISGIGLKEDDFGEIREGKYVQVIAITYEPDKNGKKKAKNISLGYFGKAETLDEAYKDEVIEFVLRWRYEKAFQNLEHYKSLIKRVRDLDDAIDS